MKIAAITDIGSCRQENQDNYCAQQLAGGTAWGIVCDGMGGVNGGRIAARIATDTMQQYFARHMKALQPGMEKTFIMRGFDITNRAVYEKSTSDPEMQGMGTTGVCAYASRGHGPSGTRRGFPRVSVPCRYAAADYPRPLDGAAAGGQRPDHP